MPYCSQNDLLKMISETELAELTAEVGEIPDAEVVAEAIDQASAEIDSYLGLRYSLPLNQVPPQVKSLAVTLALYHLYARRNLAPAVRRQNYDAAVAFLKEVAGGQATLAGVGGDLPSASREACEVSGARRVFSRDILEDW